MSLPSGTRPSILIGLISGVALAIGVSATMTARPWSPAAQAPAPAQGVEFVQLRADDMREWLTYLASDELRGRAIYTEGYGLAVQYVVDHLRQWGVTPLGANGTYLQPVRMKTYRVNRRSTVTITLPSGARTFAHGDHVAFLENSGGAQTVNYTRVELVGFGAGPQVRDRDLTDALVVRVPNPAAPPGRGGNHVGDGLARNGGRGGGRGGGGRAALTAGAAGLVTFAPVPPVPTDPSSDDFVSPQRVDAVLTPEFSADDVFMDALFSTSPVSFAAIKAKAERGEPLEPMTFAAQVSVTINNTFEVVSEQVSHNVVGMVEGTDPTLKSTYVMLGAHLDGVGASETGESLQPSGAGCRPRMPLAVDALEAAGRTARNPQSVNSVGARGGGGRGAGRGGRGGRGAAVTTSTPWDQRDVINNGADDDGSGSVALMAIARAFATGPKPKRSMVFIWHTGEERGLLGSSYNVDFPVVPLDTVQAFITMDAIGRDDCDNLEGDYSNTLFIIGADRISTDLHNMLVLTNEQQMSQPLTLDYENNDPADPAGAYGRADHFNYAAKGIPVAFLSTGLHSDYHRATDTVDKIVFPKMARIAQFVYQAGFGIANSDAELARDNKGPRTGFGSKATVIR